LSRVGVRMPLRAPRSARVTPTSHAASRTFHRRILCSPAYQKACSMADQTYGAAQDLLERMLQTAVPLLVRRSCNPHKQSCWAAMRFIIEVLGDPSFGARDVAREMNTRSYPRVSTWIAELVDAGLMTIIRTEEVPGGLHERGVYAIPWDYILGESIRLAKEELGQDRRYRRAPLTAPPEQTSLPLDELDQLVPMDHSQPPTVIHGSQSAPPLLPIDHSTVIHGSQEGDSLLPIDHSAVIHGSQSAPHCDPWVTDTVIHGSQSDPSLLPMDHSDCDPWVTDTVIHGSQSAPPMHTLIHSEHTDMHDHAARARATTSMSAPPKSIPTSPPAEFFDDHPQWKFCGRLYAHPLALWEDSCERPTRMDRHVLASLAEQHNAATSGYGWYWLGIAIVVLAGSGQPIGSTRSLKSVLSDWQTRDAYGADRARYTAKVAAAAADPTPRRETYGPGTPRPRRPDATRYAAAAHEPVGAAATAPTDLSDEDIDNIERSTTARFATGRALIR